MSLVSSSGDVAQSSGTHDLSTNRPADVSQSGVPAAPSDGEEQALESHEVIELQTFSERKAWIEHKIKFLEKMPPIEVFVGLEAVSASAEEVPGLPTRDELKQWITEHDAIEKETEIFDRGELTKLRQLTKAATQRNLSPADTDVIELTLTTIYELDKLLHLLRDRSENLELLGIRLTWEESRISAWVDRRKIFEDLQNFLETRVRWDPSCYENVLKQDESHDLARRGSVTSIASNASDSSITSQAFSRSVRFKMAEILSRDAAQFAARVTSLRHGKIAAAGKALDKLIDHSRRPVPDVLLDEQDRLEEKGITDLEHIGKFIMSLVMQWRKADEIYIETMKDKVTAQNLYEEVETAKLHHPTARQSTSFVSRADTLIKRLALRSNPASSSGTFPHPEHPLFPMQTEFNKTLAEALSAEISAAAQIAKKVDAMAKSYSLGYEATKHVENLSMTAASLSMTFTRILGLLREGIPAGDGDGSPLNLTTEACLEPSRHSAFLALLPSIIQDNVQAAESSGHILESSAAAMSNLNHPGIEPVFVTNAATEFQQLSSLRRDAGEACEAMKSRAGRLREARRIWGLMTGTIKNLEDVRQMVAGAIERARWRQIPGQMGPSNSDNSPAKLSAQALEELHRIQDRLADDIVAPLDTLAKALEPSLNHRFVQSVIELNSFLSATIKMAHLLESIQRQANLMRSVHDEFHELHTQLEDTIRRVESLTNGVLTDGWEKKGISEAGDQTDMKSISEKVTNFINHLPQRISFVGDQADLIQVTSEAAKKSPLLSSVRFNTSADLPIDFASLDSTVRADSNSYVIQLNGKVERFAQAISHFQIACMGKEVDDALQGTVTDIDVVCQDLSGWKLKLSDIISGESDVLPALETFSKFVEDSSHFHEKRLAGLFSPLHKSLRQLEAAPRGAHDLYVTRRNGVDHAESRYKSWWTDISAFKDDIRHQQKVERDRLTRIFLEEEQREQATKARIAAEQAEKLRLEEERMAFEEEKRRLEANRRAEELRQHAEIERMAVEEAEKAHLEQERIQAEEKRRLEEERVTEERRMKAEKERAAAEEAEKAQLRDQRLMVEEKLRLVEEELAQERRFQAEKERLALEKFKQQSREQVLAEKYRTEVVAKQQHKLQERRLQEEPERLKQVKTNENPFQDTAQDGLAARSLDIEDVFSLRIVSPEKPRKTKEMSDLQAQILAFRKRLRSININEISRPSRSTAVLPNLEQLKNMTREFTSIASGVSLLPASVTDIAVDVELKSLRSEIEASAALMKRVEKLAQFSEDIHACDAALSDLLEHLDSYPTSPKGILSSSYAPATDTPPEEQLSGRLSFTRTVIDNMISVFAGVAKDLRAIAEQKRVLQTWSELEEMSNDQLGGKISRPASVISSRASSHRPTNTLVGSTPVNNGRHAKKHGSYFNLSVSSTSSQKRLLAPPHQPSSRRAVSGSAESQSRQRYESRPPSQLSSLSSNRSVSGPLGLSIYGSTFASRQRTASLSNSTSTPARHVPIPPTRHRAQTGHDKRVSSPTGSEASSYIRTHSRSSTSMSTWARAPRNSLSSLLPSISTTVATPQKRTPIPRKKYIADPKNKLDVAVGDVVNKLPVGIKVEGVSETWKDRSGKYWIGNQDPKLCFCRILRSQTVMVRVGGGWSELSKFIQDHFAESFRLIPESPPRPGGTEEKWISSATLLEQAESESPPVPPRTPEPNIPFVSSFALQTPTRQSPHSVKSTSPSVKGSPLTPLQFIRRADVDAILRPVTPSKPLSLRTRNATPHTHTSNRNIVWRP